MSLHSTLQRFTTLYLVSTSRYFRIFIGILLAPFLLITIVGHEPIILNHPGLFWGGYTVALLLLIALGFGSRMYRQNAYRGKGLSINPTHKSKGWS